MGAPVTHFEVNVKDRKSAYDFYSNLFGWTVNDAAQADYGMVNTGVKMGINGGIGGVSENMPPNVMFYVQVENPQAYLDKAAGLGGSVVVQVTEIPGMVTYASLADPEGNVIGLVKGPQSPPEPPRPKPAARPTKKRKKAARPKPKAKRGKRK